MQSTILKMAEPAVRYDWIKFEIHAAVCHGCKHEFDVTAWVYAHRAGNHLLLLLSAYSLAMMQLIMMMMQVRSVQYARLPLLYVDIHQKESPDRYSIMVVILNSGVWMTNQRHQTEWVVCIYIYDITFLTRPLCLYSEWQMRRCPSYRCANVIVSIVTCWCWWQMDIQWADSKALEEPDIDR